jgi:mediator of RNA polymerase II transcription subunit 17
MADVNSNSFPISLRPWAKEDSNTEPLGDLIYRINIERKGFRNVTEGQLREEIDRAANEMVQDEEMESDEEAKEDEEKGTAKYIAKKRAELTYYLRCVYTFEA